MLSSARRSRLGSILERWPLEPPRRHQHARRDRAHARERTAGFARADRAPGCDDRATSASPPRLWPAPTRPGHATDPPPCRRAGAGCPSTASEGSGTDRPGRPRARRSGRGRATHGQRVCARDAGRFRTHAAHRGPRTRSRSAPASTRRRGTRPRSPPPGRRRGAGRGSRRPRARAPRASRPPPGSGCHRRAAPARRPHP